MADQFNLVGAVTAPEVRVLGQQVVDQLRVLIITGQIPTGAHLVEAPLSETFGVSRGPIRDALAKLEAEGLVESRRRGMVARGLTLHDIDELYAVREAIETMALTIAAGASREAWDTALAPLATMRTAAAAGDHLAYAHADTAFHSCFYRISGHKRLEDVWRQYEPTFGVLLELTTAEDIDLGPSLDSHVRLHQLMVDGDVDKALPELREHLLGSRTRLVNAFARMTGQPAPADAAEEASA